MSSWALGLAVSTLPAQSVAVRGVVRDADNGRPVKGARVALGAWLGAWTGADGRFSFPAPPGRYAPFVSCPVAAGGGLAAEADSVTLGPDPAPLDLQLAHGADCLEPLSATSYGEFTGTLAADGPSRLLRLCDGAGHRVAIDFPAKIWRGLVFQATRSEDDRRTELTIRVRGRLEGPGFFGGDGSAGYLIEVDSLLSFAKRMPTEACDR